jgi:hypothetical protein
MEVNGMDFSYSLQMGGALCFGILMGWYLYYINRYRKEEIKLNDLLTLVGILGGGAILTLFPAKSDLFGAYGIGLFIGFFGYFLSLLIFVSMSPNFDHDWFLDGRRKRPVEPFFIPEGVVIPMKAMTLTEDISQKKETDQKM